MARRTRKELKEIFKAGAQPTGQDFHDFIDSIINALEDGIEKPEEPNLPIRLRSNGTKENLLDFYNEEGIHSWRINQYPTDQYGMEATSRAGLNFEDSIGESRLFIKQDNGNIGIGNLNPNAKLHVIQRGTQGDSFRVDDMGDDTTPFMISGDGAVRIRVNPEEYEQKLSLHVQGPVRMQNTDPSLPSFTILKGIDADSDGKADLTVDTDGDGIPDIPEAAFSVTKTGAIGIGTDAPQEGIRIKGTVLFDNDLEIGGDLTVRGNLFARDVEEIKNIRDVRFGDQDEDTFTISGEIRSAHSTGALCIWDALNVKDRAIIGSSYYTDPDVQKDSAPPVNGLLVQGCTGLGTTSPEAKLAVNGGVHVGGDSDPGDDNIRVDGNAIVDGKIGIGIDNPLAALHIDGSVKIENGDLTLGQNLNASGYIAAASLTVTGTVTAPTIISDKIRAEDTMGLRLYDKNDPGKGIFIKDGGNVGIGTADPDTALHVKGSVKIENGDLSIGGTLSVLGGFNAGDLAVDKIGAASGDGLKLYDKNNPGKGIFVKDGGDVGIGTIEPGAKLHVKGSARIDDGDLTLSRNLTIAGALNLGESPTINAFSSNTALSGASNNAVPTELAVKTYVDSAVNNVVSAGNDFSVNNLTVSGSIGIGTDTPSASLEIAGNLKLQHGVTINRISNDELSDSETSVPTEKAVKTFIEGSQVWEFENPIVRGISAGGYAGTTSTSKIHQIIMETKTTSLVPTNAVTGANKLYGTGVSAKTHGYFIDSQGNAGGTANLDDKFTFATNTNSHLGDHFTNAGRHCAYSFADERNNFCFVGVNSDQNQIKIDASNDAQVWNKANGWAKGSDNYGGGGWHNEIYGWAANGGRSNTMRYTFSTEAFATISVSPRGGADTASFNNSCNTRKGFGYFICSNHASYYYRVDKFNFNLETWSHCSNSSTWYSETQWAGGQYAGYICGGYIGSYIKLGAMIDYSTDGVSSVPSLAAGLPLSALSMCSSPV